MSTADTSPDTAGADPAPPAPQAEVGDGQAGATLTALVSPLVDSDDSAGLLRLLELLFTNMTEAIVVADDEGNLILHNPASLALHGYANLDQALGTIERVGAMWEVLDLEGRPLPVAQWPLSRALRGERFSGYEVCMRRRDGSNSFVGAYSGTPIFDKGPRPHYAFITIRDVTEQKEAEAALRASEARFRSVLEGSLDAAYRRDLTNDSYDYLSPRIEHLTGFTPAEMNRMSIAEVWERVHPEEREMVQAAVAEAVESGRALVEYRFRDKDGRYRWLADSFSVETDAGGRPLFRAGTLRDIGERKQAEARLREREEAFATLANFIPQLAWMTDAEGWIYWYNQRWYDYTGTTLEEVEGWGWQQVHHPDHVERVVEHIRHAFATGEPWEDTFPLRRYDGVYRWFLSRAVPIRDEMGQIVRWFGTNTDITERLQLERALHQRESQLRELNRGLEQRVEERSAALGRAGEALLEARNRFFTLFHASPIPTLLSAVDDTVLLDANAALLEFLHLEKEAIVGCQLAELADIMAVGPQLERLGEHFRQQGQIANYELSLVDGGGEARTVLLSVESAMLEGRPVAVSTMIDITERKQAEEHVRELAIELSLAQERERKRIAQILHDDVQQVLVALQLQLSMGLDAEPEPMRAVLDNAQAYAAEALALTRSLSVELSSPVVDTDRLLDGFAWVQSFMSDRYGLAVAYDVDDAIQIPDPHLRAVVLRLVRELLFNAVKHADVEQATLRAWQEGEKLLIQVEDAGAGFDPAALSSRPGGTGYGLTSMGERLALFGGRLEIDSAPGEGTCVTLLIPLTVGS